MNGEDKSSLYAKAGFIPQFLVNHTYSTVSPVSNEFRFGGYNIFDLQIDGGIGYDFKITKSLHAMAEATFFQGMMPVLTNYNVYNYGFMTGVGLALML
jgi:hypothetical protein